MAVTIMMKSEIATACSGGPSYSFHSFVQTGFVLAPVFARLHYLTRLSNLTANFKNVRGKDCHDGKVKVDDKRLHSI